METPASFILISLNDSASFSGDISSSYFLPGACSDVTLAMYPGCLPPFFLPTS